MNDKMFESIFKFDNLKEESLDIDISECAIIPSNRNASLFNIWSGNEDSNRTILIDSTTSNEGFGDLINENNQQSIVGGGDSGGASGSGGGSEKIPSNFNGLIKKEVEESTNDSVVVVVENIQTNAKNEMTLNSKKKKRNQKLSITKKNNLSAGEDNGDGGAGGSGGVGGGVNANKTTTNGVKPLIEYSCHNCGVIITSRMEFDQHYRSQHNEEPIYTCVVCNKRMENMRSFRNHYLRHKMNKFRCSMCPKKFLNQELLNEHLTIHTTDDIRQVCKDCPEVFATYMELKKHSKQHKIVERKKKLEAIKWKCEECGKILRNRNSLSIHLKLHRTDRPYQCTMCNQNFLQKFSLIQHIMKNHTNEKPFSCEECGKGFSGKSELLRHNIFHQDTRTFKCETCGKMYKTVRHLKVHQLVHIDRRPHACTHCHKSFLSSSKLKQHYNIHTGARPYICKYCTKDFTNFPNWLKHIRRLHKVDHKTGEVLSTMPTFLIKDKKNNSTKSTTITSATKVASPLSPILSSAAAVAVEECQPNNNPNVIEFNNTNTDDQRSDNLQLLTPKTETILAETTIQMIPFASAITTPIQTTTTTTTNQHHYPQSEIQCSENNSLFEIFSEYSSSELEKATTILLQENFDQDSQNIRNFQQIANITSTAKQIINQPYQTIVPSVLVTTATTSPSAASVASSSGQQQQQIEWEASPIKRMQDFTPISTPSPSTGRPLITLPPISTMNTQYSFALMPRGAKSTHFFPTNVL